MHFNSSIGVSGRFASEYSVTGVATEDIAGGP